VALVSSWGQGIEGLPRRAEGRIDLAVWDERRFAKEVRMRLKELADLHRQAQTFGEQLSAVEADGDRGDAQRDRGESWGELADALEQAGDSLADALDTVEGHFR
jgi:hypothetical protein